MLDDRWAAGFFEGEGTVRINNPLKRTLGHLVVSIVNTDKSLIDGFIQKWNGTIHSATGLRPDQRPAWVWIIVARQAVPFLEAILPYIVSPRQRKRIQLGLEYQRQKHHGGKWITDEYREQQFSYWLQMRELNVRGNRSPKSDQFSSPHH